MDIAAEDLQTVAFVHSMLSVLIVLGREPRDA